MATKPSRRRPLWVRIARATLFLLLLVLIVPLLIPLPPRTGLQPVANLAGPESRFVTIDGIAVHYKSYGSGEPAFVLLHGFGASEFSWRHVVEPLAEYGTVIAFDRPGFGLTERPMPGEWTERSPYSDEAFTRLTLDLLTALGIERAILVGHSAGGTVAVRVALEHPEAVAGLVLAAPALQGGGYQLSPLVRAIAASPQGRRIGPWLIRALLGRLASALDIAWHDPSAVDDETAAGYRLPLTALDWDRALWELTVAPKGPALVDRLSELTMPVLYVTGDDDRIVPAAATQSAAAATPGALLVVIPECGHLPHEERPAAFLAAVEQLLEMLVAP